MNPVVHFRVNEKIEFAHTLGISTQPSNPIANQQTQQYPQSHYKAIACDFEDYYIRRPIRNLHSHKPPYSLLLVMVFGIQQGYFENLHPFSSFKLSNIYAQKPPNRLCFKTSSCFSCLRRNLLTARFKNLLPDVEQCFFFNRHALQWQIPIPVVGSFILYTFYQFRSLIKSNNHICIFLTQNHIIQRTDCFG